MYYVNQWQVLLLFVLQTLYRLFWNVTLWPCVVSVWAADGARVGFKSSHLGELHNLMLLFYDLNQLIFHLLEISSSPISLALLFVDVFAFWWQIWTPSWWLQEDFWDMRGAVWDSSSDSHRFVCISQTEIDCRQMILWHSSTSRAVKKISLWLFLLSSESTLSGTKSRLQMQLSNGIFF